MGLWEPGHRAHPLWTALDGMTRLGWYLNRLYPLFMIKNDYALLSPMLNLSPFCLVSLDFIERNLSPPGWAYKKKKHILSPPQFNTIYMPGMIAFFIVILKRDYQFWRCFAYFIRHIGALMPTTLPFSKKNIATKEGYEYCGKRGLPCLQHNYQVSKLWYCFPCSVTNVYFFFEDTNLHTYFYTMQ